MTPIRPYKISVYNRITGDQFAEYLSNQVPGRGDQITVFATHKNPDNPFHLWGHWVVDAVVWCVSSPASVNAFEIAKQTGGDMAAAYCAHVEVHVWPAEGPHWVETPRFAKVLSPDDDEADDTEVGT